MGDGVPEGVHSGHVPAQGGRKPELVSIIPWDPIFFSAQFYDIVSFFSVHTPPSTVLMVKVILTAIY